MDTTTPTGTGGDPACTTDHSTDQQTGTTDPAATLEKIRERAEAAQEYMQGDPVPPSLDDVPRLLKAVEAALKFHQPGRMTILGGLCKRHENHRHFSITRTEADAVRACPDCTATVYRSCTGCGPGVDVEACVTRNAITAALAGKEADR